MKFCKRLRGCSSILLIARGGEGWGVGGMLSKTTLASGCETRGDSGLNLSESVDMKSLTRKRVSYQQQVVFVCLMLHRGFVFMWRLKLLQ